MKLTKLMLLLLFFASLPIHSRLYTFDDLQTLEKNKNYREFLEHAYDIRPSKRDKRWVSMLEHMASDYLSEVMVKELFDAETYQFIQTLASKPTLKKDVFFQTKRDRYFINFLQNCLQQKEFKHSHKKAKIYWKRSRQNPDTGFQIAKNLNAFNPKQFLGHFLNAVIKDKHSKFYCDKKFVLNTLDQIFLEKAKKTKNLDQLKKNLDKSLHFDCWKSYAQHLKEKLNQTKPSARHAYLLLKSKKALKQSEEDIFLTLYLLRDPIPGKVFNLAWAYMLQLGSDYERRKKVIDHLKSRAHLPDKSFRGDKLKAKTLLKFLNENIPEYIDHYALSCLDYHMGRVNFPQGNPTLNCQNFFEISEGMPWMRQDLKMRYSSIKKFESN